jgi:hypothetical protein
MAQLIPIPRMINGHSYEWSDVQLSINGSIPVIGITEINYSSTRNTQLIMGAGSEGISKGYGAKSYTASITLKLEEVQSLVAIAPFNDLTAISNFTVDVFWLDSENLIIHNKLIFCTFMNNEIKTKQGDTSTDVVLNLCIGGIDFA